MQDSTVVAHRTSEGIVCVADAECAKWYAQFEGVMEGGVPMTQDDIENEQDNCDGVAIKCVGCLAALDLHNMSAR